MSKLNVGAVVTEPGSTVKNKTGNWRTLRPVVDSSKCTKCGLCWSFCPDISIKVDKVKGVIFDLNHCKGCGICSQVCPVNAIIMVKEEK